MRLCPQGVCWRMGPPAQEPFASTARWAGVGRVSREPGRGEEGRQVGKHMQVKPAEGRQVVLMAVDSWACCESRLTGAGLQESCLISPSLSHGSTPHHLLAHLTHHCRCCCRLRCGCLDLGGHLGGGCSASCAGSHSRAPSCRTACWLCCPWLSPARRWWSCTASWEIATTT